MPAISYQSIGSRSTTSAQDCSYGCSALHPELGFTGEDQPSRPPISTCRMMTAHASPLFGDLLVAKDDAACITAAFGAAWAIERRVALRPPPNCGSVREMQIMVIGAC